VVAVGTGTVETFGDPNSALPIDDRLSFGQTVNETLLVTY
jgi:hypothetical protein